MLTIRVLKVDLGRFSSRFKRHVSSTSIQEVRQLCDDGWLARGRAELPLSSLGSCVTHRHDNEQQRVPPSLLCRNLADCVVGELLNSNLTRLRTMGAS